MRTRTIVGLVVVAALCVWAARVDVPRLAGPIIGDEGNYIAMAFSLAKDHDLKYRPEDYHRFRELYGSGPEGVFLKRHYQLEWHLHAGWPPIQVVKTPVPSTIELDYGKPFAYPVLAAPFVALFGLGGMLLLNVLLLGVSIWCAVVFARARAGSVAGTIIGLAFFGASIVPAYVATLTPEIFNVALVVSAYFLWLYKTAGLKPGGSEYTERPTFRSAGSWLTGPWTDWAAAALLGVATFSKPLNGPLIAPLVGVALLRRQWTRAIGLAAGFALVAGGLFAINGLVTGEWNYQGGQPGDRNYFVTNFPFDEKGTSFEDGHPMVTNEATDQDILAPAYLFPTLGKNAIYFVVGRDAGLLPYFFPGALIVLAWLLKPSRWTSWQWMSLAAWKLAVLADLVLVPDSWNGGGGPLGNRYFLSLYPVLLFLLPAAWGMAWSVVAAGVGLLCVGPILARPFLAKQAPWTAPERWPLRTLPIEFTILNQLPVALNQQRYRIPVSADPVVFLYYMDGRTYYGEPGGGFWVAPGTAEIIVRTERPLTGLRLHIRSNIPNVVDMSIDGRSAHSELTPDTEQSIYLRPEPGFYALRSYQVLWRITTKDGFYPSQFNRAATDTRLLGVFITPTYEVR